jgi:type IV secretion system protein TrbG
VKARTRRLRFAVHTVVGFALAWGPFTTQSEAQTTAPETGAVTVALREVQERGWAPRVVRTNDAIVYPFGHVDPVLTCAPLRACFIALETGEQVTGVARGDAVRWKVDTIGQSGEARRTLVVVKPTRCNIATNLVVATDRRVYDVALVSPPCEGEAGAAGASALRHVGFYFPDAPVRERADSESKVVAPTATTTAGSQAAPAPPERLNFAYQWHAAKAVPWAPLTVYDDSAHLYVRLPDAARFSAAPALWEVQPDGSRALLNYVLRDGTYKTDHLVDRAVLSLGSGKNERSVEIVSARWHDGQ